MSTGVDSGWGDEAPLPGPPRRMQAFGRVLEAPWRLPFAPASADAPPTLSLRARAALPSPAGQRLHAVRDFARGPRLEVWREASGALAVLYDGWQLRWEAGDSALELAPMTRSHVHDLAIAVERALLPLALLLRDDTLVGLHGSAVALADRAWVFTGASGVGKSTTARVLIEHGEGRLLADDLSLIDVARRQALPGGAALRLWQDAPPRYAEEARAIASLPHAKRWFRMRASALAGRRVALAGVVTLAPSDEVDAARLEPLRGRAAASALLEQSFTICAPQPGWAERRFRLVCQLAREAAVYRLVYRRSAQGEPTHVAPLLEALRRVTR